MNSIEHLIKNEDFNSVNHKLNNVKNIIELQDIYKQILYFSKNTFYCEFLSHPILNKYNINNFIFEYSLKNREEIVLLEVIKARNEQFTFSLQEATNILKELIFNKFYNSLEKMLSNKNYNQDNHTLIRIAIEEQNKTLWLIISKNKQLKNLYSSKEYIETYNRIKDKYDNFLNFINTEETKQKLNKF
jgi:hypothetical protein